MSDLGSQDNKYRWTNKVFTRILCWCIYVLSRKSVGFIITWVVFMVQLPSGRLHVKNPILITRRILYLRLKYCLSRNIISMSSERVSLQVTIWISPDNVQRFFDELRPVYDKVIAEPQCTFFEVYEDPEVPGQISWVENWSVGLAIIPWLS